MDEIGRGTSTFDGLSLAWAVARHLATREPQLHAVRDALLRAHAPGHRRSPGVVNLHLDATEHGDGIVFLHAVKEGPANRSYGLAVAQLAGVPREIIAAAREYLAALEKGRRRPRADAAWNRADAVAAARAHAAGPTTARAAAATAAGSAAAGTGGGAARGGRRRSHPEAALDLVYKLRSLLG